MLPCCFVVLFRPLFGLVFVSVVFTTCSVYSIFIFILLKLVISITSLQDMLNNVTQQSADLRSKYEPQRRQKDGTGWVGQGGVLPVRSIP